MAVLILVDSKTLYVPLLLQSKMRLSSMSIVNHHRFILRDKSQVTSDLLCDNLMDLTCSCVNAIIREHHSV